MKPTENGRVTGVTLGYIIITNITGAIVGTVLAIIFTPGLNLQPSETWGFTSTETVKAY